MDTTGNGAATPPIIDANKEIVRPKNKTAEAIAVIMTVLFILSVSYILYCRKNVSDNTQYIPSTNTPSPMPTPADPTPTAYINYMPVKSGTSQKIAQTFKVPGIKSIVGLTLLSSYGTGGTFTVSLWQLADPDNPAAGTMIRQMDVDATSVIRGREFSVMFAQPYELKPETVYAIVIEASDRATEVNIAFAEADVDPTGSLFEYTRQYGGNGELLSPKLKWQAKRTYDMVFTLMDEGSAVR